MGKKLYVGNIPFQATEEMLTEHFAKMGEILSTKIIVDMQTGQSKGFAFVEMASEEDADKAIADLNGAPFMERNIIVNEARPQKPRTNRGFSDRGGGQDKRRGGGFRKGAGRGREKRW